MKVDESPRTDPSNSKSKSWIEKPKMKKKTTNQNSLERRDNIDKMTLQRYNILHTNVYYDDGETGVARKNSEGEEDEPRPDQMAIVVSNDRKRIAKGQRRTSNCEEKEGERSGLFLSVECQT